MHTIIDAKYTLLKLIGTGQYSRVYTAFNMHKQIVVVKIFHNDTSLDSFNQEIAIILRLHAHNYITIYDSNYCGQLMHNGKSHPRPYIAMEHFPNHEITHYLTKPFPERVAKSVFTHILQEVHKVHKLGICHRDIKCQNIVLDAHYHPRLVDFGLSSLHSDVHYDICGTECYLAPEILKKFAYDGHQADVFALGIVLFCIVYGVQPFKKAAISDPRYKALAKNPSEFWSWIEMQTSVKMPTEFKSLFLSITADNPYMRPSVEELIGNIYLSKDVADEAEVKKMLDERGSVICPGMTIDSETMAI
jgi:serine/threonine protein kinase